MPKMITSAEDAVTTIIIGEDDEDVLNEVISFVYYHLRRVTKRLIYN